MPNRIIKESIRTSEKVDQLSSFHETFFYRLTVTVDDFGRYDARHKILKAALYPLKDKVTVDHIEAALCALEEVGLVERYSVDGDPYVQICGWEKHQQIRNHKSKFPAPDGTITENRKKEEKKKDALAEVRDAAEGHVDSKSEQLQEIEDNCEQLISIDINCNQMKSLAPTRAESESESESESLSTLTGTRRPMAEESEPVEIPPGLKQPRHNYQQLVRRYHELCPSLPQCTKLTDQRKTKLRVRLKTYSEEELESAFLAAERSDFCSGRSGGSWRADLDWIIRNDENVSKLLGGSYENKTKKGRLIELARKE